MKNWRRVFKFRRNSIRKNPVHAELKVPPLVGTPEVVHHEESTAQKVIAELGGLSIGKIPLPPLHRVEPRPVKDVVVIIQIDGLLDRSRVDARQAPDGSQEMAIGPRIILSPDGITLGPAIRGEAAKSEPAASAERRIHQAG